MTKNKEGKLEMKFSTPDQKRFDRVHKGTMDLLPLPSIKSTTK